MAFGLETGPENVVSIKVVGVGGGGNLAAARRTAAVNVRVETGAHRLPALHEAVPAGGKPEHGGRLVHRLLDVIAAHIRPDIPRAVVRCLLCLGNAGKRRWGDADIVIALVVLEQDVVTRLKALDQRVFQQQGVGLAPHDDMADLDDLLHQHTHLRAVLLRLHEIGRHPFAQALGLAHVDDRPRAVHELVDARRQRQQGHLLLEIRFFRFSHTPCKFSKYIANRKVYKKVAFFV